MIKEHEFHTRWWGSPVGIVTDPAFFTLSIDDQQKALSPFEWVELTSPLDQAPPPERLFKSGFFQTNTQINFRINVRRIPSSPSIEELEVRFADEEQFRISADEISHFENERFFLLPGITQEKIDMRYVLLSNQTIEQHPSLCLQVIYNGEVAGWFLSSYQVIYKGKEKLLYLTLAMLKRGSKLSGHLLYQKALNAYGQRGEHIAWAGFGVNNTSVHNIYAGLGARFTAPDGHWLWIRSL